MRQKISMSNCYVITPPEDSIESIFDCAKKLAEHTIRAVAGQIYPLFLREVPRSAMPKTSGM